MLRNNRARINITTFFAVLTLIVILISAYIALDVAYKVYSKMSGKKSESATEKSWIIIKKPNDKKDRLQEPLGIKEKIAKSFQLWKLRREVSQEAANMVIEDNEKQAAKLLKRFAQAQEIFKKHTGSYAERATGLIIDNAGKIEIIDPELAVINYSYSRERATNGYYFMYGDKDKTDDFFLYAVPAQYKKSGINTLCIDSRGIVFKKDNKEGN